MPYSKTSELPDKVKVLPQAAQRQFLAVLNSAMGRGASEESAFKQAWGAVKQKWHQVDGKWIKKKEGEMGEERYLVPFDFADGSLLFPIGPCVWFPNGEFTRADAEELVGNFKSNLLERTGGKLPINKEHERSGGVIGHVVDVELRDDGVHGTYEWEDEEAARKFGYTSPEIAWEWRHPFTGKKHRNVLQGVGVTNYPKLLGGNAIARFSEGSWEYEVEESEDELAEGDAGKAKAAQEARSKKYGIAIHEGGNVTKPSEWEDVPDSEWADSVNYAYPCPNAEQTRAAIRYWGQEKNREKYDDKSRAVVTKKLEGFAKKFDIGQEEDMAELDKEVIEQAAQTFGERVLAWLKMNGKVEETPEPPQDYAEEIRKREEQLQSEFNDKLAEKEAELQKLSEAKAALEAEAQKLAEEKAAGERERRLGEFAETARELEVPTEVKGFAETLMVFYDADASEDKAQYNQLIAVMKALRNQEKMAALFSEMGSGGQGGTSEQKLDRLISEYAEAHKVSIADATDAIVKLHPDLYRDYDKNS